MVRLTPEEEQNFYKWYADTVKNIGVKTGFSLNENPDDPGHAYDYRGFYKAMTAGDPAAISSMQSDGSIHFTSPFKQPGHHTYQYKDLLDLFTENQYSPESWDAQHEQVKGNKFFSPDEVREYILSRRGGNGGG